MARRRIVAPERVLHRSFTRRFAHPPGRTTTFGDALAHVERYCGDNTPLMFYRTDLNMHSVQVKELSRIIQELEGRVFSKINHHERDALALHHDDVELLTGDEPVVIKEANKNNPHYQARKNLEEQWAIDQLTNRFDSTRQGIDYFQALERMRVKAPDDITAGLVKYADLVCGYGESIHEVRGGNHRFIPVANGYVHRIKKWIQEKKETLPVFSGRKRTRHPIFNLPHTWDFTQLAKEGRQHNSASLARPTGDAHYDLYTHASRAAGLSARLLIKREGEHSLGLLSPQARQEQELATVTSVVGATPTIIKKTTSGLIVVKKLRQDYREDVA